MDLNEVDHVKTHPFQANLTKMAERPRKICQDKAGGTLRAIADDKQRLHLFVWLVLVYH